jgi:hypothetical protein
VHPKQDPPPPLAAPPAGTSPGASYESPRVAHLPTQENPGAVGTSGYNLLHSIFFGFISPACFWKSNCSSAGGECCCCEHGGREARCRCRDCCTAGPLRARAEPGLSGWTQRARCSLYVYGWMDTLRIWLGCCLRRDTDTALTNRGPRQKDRGTRVTACTASRPK